MTNLVSKNSGGKVLMVSSLDMNHPGDNIIDGSEHSYWISTGLYPQEILFELSSPAPVNSIRISTTNVKSVRIEACAEDKPVNFKTLVERDLEEKQGSLQTEELTPKDGGGETASFVKVVVLSGWHDFCSVHKVAVQ
mmetsp:Transcript_24066/g.71625  ORF Transcript_24066/g.71625 Transcript_24066/m.71625 type:complete len:137 (-) Transcript_24066:84-494(-)